MQWKTLIINLVSNTRFASMLKAEMSGHFDAQLGCIRIRLLLFFSFSVKLYK